MSQHPPEPVTAAIVGPGNIGTDLLVKLQRSAPPATPRPASRPST